MVLEPELKLKDCIAQMNVKCYILEPVEREMKHIYFEFVSPAK